MANVVSTDDEAFDRIARRKWRLYLDPEGDPVLSMFKHPGGVLVTDTETQSETYAVLATLGLIHQSL